MAKLLEKWKDYFNEVEFRLYKVGSKSHLIYAIDRKSHEYRISYIIRAGSYFEKNANVPDGTAHFLEHLLCGPNNKFATEEAIKLYCLGSMRKPAIYTNAYTSYLRIKFFAEGHIKGKKRIHDFFYNTVKYPIEKFGENIEKERKIILAERKTDLKKSLDEKYNLIKYMNDDDKYNGCTKEVVGTSKTINAITVDDLQKYYKLAFNQQNLCFAVQSASVPTKKDLAYFDDLANYFPSQKAEIWQKVREEKLNNTYSVRYFNKPDERGLQLVFLDKTKKYPISVYKNLKERYADAHKDYLTFLLFNHLTMQRMRTESSLIYSSIVFNLMINWHWLTSGLTINCSYANLPEVVDQLYEIIINESKKYLDSPEGKTWFSAQSQRFIYPMNIEFDPMLAEKAADSFLLDYVYKSDYKLLRSVYLNATIEDIKAHIDRIIKTKMPKIWITGSEKEEKVLSIIRKSKLNQHYSKKKNIVTSQ